ncbi:4845_t:CDS:1, partial [Funneliformis caledonium]
NNIFTSMENKENINNNPSNDNYSNLFTNEELIDDNDIFDDLINVTKKALSLIEEQKLVGNVKWCKAIKKSFEPIIKLVDDVEKYQRKRTMPLT